jgi:hypothetical protein
VQPLAYGATSCRQRTGRQEAPVLYNTDRREEHVGNVEPHHGRQVARHHHEEGDVPDWQDDFSEGEEMLLARTDLMRPDTGTYAAHMTVMRALSSYCT